MTTKRNNKRPEAPIPAVEVDGPVRTCVACRARDDRDDLVRWVEGDDGRVLLDARAVRSGRGVWVHPTRGCITVMVKRHAAERSLKIDVDKALDAGALIAQLRGALLQRITSFIVVSSRRRAIAVGAEAVAAALEKRHVRAVIVAGDAGTTARSLADTPGHGGPRVLRYADKATLGALFNRAEVALVALLDHRIAGEAASTIDRLAALEES